jgi:hypothetical protein
VDHFVRDWRPGHRLLQADRSKTPILRAGDDLAQLRSTISEGRSMEGFPRSILLALLATLALATSQLHAQVRLPAVEPDTAAVSQVAHLQRCRQLRPSVRTRRASYSDRHRRLRSAFRTKSSLGSTGRESRRFSMTEQSLARTLMTTVTSTKVRINQYDPGGEWHWLAANKKVGAGWRYTFGPGTLAYTPSRTPGADGYNPHRIASISIPIFHAWPKNEVPMQSWFIKREYPGTYVAVTSLPFVRLWLEKEAKDDVLDYTAGGTPDQHRAAIHAISRVCAEIAES